MNSVIEVDKMRAFLWAAWKELNAIRARDGSPQHIQWGASGPMQTSGCDEKYFSVLVDALSAILGDDARPWPTDAMKPYLKELAP